MRNKLIDGYKEIRTGTIRICSMYAVDEPHIFIRWKSIVHSCMLTEIAVVGAPCVWLTHDKGKMFRIIVYRSEEETYACHSHGRFVCFGFRPPCVMRFLSVIFFLICLFYVGRFLLQMEWGWNRMWQKKRITILTASRIKRKRFWISRYFSFHPSYSLV